jgi:hypothetical protein
MDWKGMDWKGMDWKGMDWKGIGVVSGGHVPNRGQQNDPLRLKLAIERILWESDLEHHCSISCHLIFGSLCYLRMDGRPCNQRPINVTSRVTRVRCDGDRSQT